MKFGETLHCRCIAGSGQISPSSPPPLLPSARGTSTRYSHNAIIPPRGAVKCLYEHCRVREDTYQMLPARLSCVRRTTSMLRSGTSARTALHTFSGRYTSISTTPWALPFLPDRRLSLFSRSGARAVRGGSGELRPADRRLAISVARGSQGHRSDVHAGEAGDRSVASAHSARPSGEGRPLPGCAQRNEHCIP